MFSPKDKDSLVQLPRNFARPMGMATKSNTLAIALNNQIIITANAPGLAKDYQANPGVYDSFYVPRTSFYTGALDLHDLAWTDRGLIAVNTAFSCLSALSHQFSFEPIWKPPFITELIPEDRCHLNGIAVKEGVAKYVTALGTGNTARSWKEGMLNSGVLMDITTNEIILEKLPTPHSPRWYNDGLYMLLSATGELVKVDVENKKYEIVTKLNGFLRGMDRIGDYLFIAMSKLRQSSSLFKEAPIAKEAVNCGVSVVYVPTGKQVGFINYNTTVDELFEVKVLPNTIRPNLLNIDKGVHEQTVVTRERVFWQLPKEEANPDTTT